MSYQSHRGDGVHIQSRSMQPVPTSEETAFILALKELKERAVTASPLLTDGEH